MNSPQQSKVLTAGGAGSCSTRNTNSTIMGPRDDDNDNTSSSKVIVAGGISIVQPNKNQPCTTNNEEDFELVPLEESKTRTTTTKSTTKSGMNPQEEGTTQFESQLLQTAQDRRYHDAIWLFICFLGIMFSFVAYGLLLEYTTSGGRKLHELSFLFVTSSLYTMTAAAGRYVRDEETTSIPPSRFAVLGLTSMASTFCSVRSLRYVIYPIQVLAKSCKPVPVMLMGALMGKKYPLKKYFNVCLIVMGVALFMGGGDKHKKSGVVEETGDAKQIFGIILLAISLCFDGGTGAYEDKLMSVHSVGPFDLMYNIQLGKTILAGVGLLVLNQVHIFIQMCQDMGLLLVALGLTGAMGQVFIFITIAKFGALTCSIIGLARKVTTLVASIYFYGHVLNNVQTFGLVVCISSMIMNFWGKKGGGHGHATKPKEVKAERQPMLENDELDENQNDIELASVKK